MDDFEEIARTRWNEIHLTPEAIIERFKKGGQQVDEAVLDLRPGRELNIMVAKCVMGHEVVSDAIMGELERMTDVEDSSVWSSVQQYSEDLEAAKMVVDRMVEEGYLDALLWHSYGDGKYTPAEAICKRAFIRKVFGKKQ